MKRRDVVGALRKNLRKKGEGGSKENLTKKRREYKDLIKIKKDLDKEKDLKRIEGYKIERSFWELIKSETKKRKEVSAQDI